MADEIEKCKWCGEKLNIRMRVCKNCHKHQNWLLGFLPQIGVLASLIAVVLTGAQYLLAKNEAGNANTAFLDAKEVQKDGLQNNIEVSEVLKETLQRLAEINHVVHTEDPNKMTTETIWNEIEKSMNYIENQTQDWQSQLDDLNNP